MTTSEKIYFYPVWLRIWHGFNALGIITLILTGVSMQSTNASSTIGFKFDYKYSQYCRDSRLVELFAVLHWEHYYQKR